MSKFNGLIGKERTSSTDTSVIDFIAGMILLVIGIYHIFKNTSVGVLWMSRLFGFSLPSGIVTLPILIGIGILFFKHRSLIGWLLIAIGVVFLIIQIILSVRIAFNTTSLWQYFLMFGGTFGGVGLLMKAWLR